MQCGNQKLVVFHVFHTTEHVGRGPRCINIMNLYIGIYVKFYVIVSVYIYEYDEAVCLCGYCMFYCTNVQ